MQLRSCEVPASVGQEYQLNRQQIHYYIAENLDQKTRLAHRLTEIRLQPGRGRAGGQPQRGEAVYWPAKADKYRERTRSPIYGTVIKITSQLV